MEWRRYQREVIRYALKAFDKGYRNVLIDAPTGFGKSLVNYHIATEFDSAFYVTPQIVLLDQLEKDKLIDIAVVKGRENYRCSIDRSKTAANARCVTDKRFKCYEECEYKIARAKAMDSKIAGMSFAYLIYDGFLPEEVSFGNRDLIIVDEADDIESWAEEFGSFRFKVGNQEFDAFDDVVSWAKAVLKNVVERISEIEFKVEMTDDDVKEVNRLNKYRMKLSVFISKAKKKRNWVFEKQGDYLVVKPVDVGEILNELIWSRGNYRVASSATIISKDMFCRYTGLNSSDTVIIKVPAIFEVKRRPIYYYPVAKMTKNERVNSYGKVTEVIEKIAKRHEGEKGIVHCHAYSIAKEIYNRLSVDRRVIFHDSKSRMKAFKEFMKDSGDAVFVSVGFNRGIDLKYDLCRWQVITKVPFPDISDIRVRELWVNRKAWKWVRYQAIKNLVQMYGRIVRAEDDYGVTYILDKSFEYLFRYKKELPRWFIEAVEEVSNV